MEKKLNLHMSSREAQKEFKREIQNAMNTFSRRLVKAQHVFNLYEIPQEKEET